MKTIIFLYNSMVDSLIDKNPIKSHYNLYIPIFNKPIMKCLIEDGFEYEVKNDIAKFKINKLMI